MAGKVDIGKLGKLSDTDSDIEPPSPYPLKSKSKKSDNSSPNSPRLPRSPKSPSSPLITASPIQKLEIKLNNI